MCHLPSLEFLASFQDGTRFYQCQLCPQRFKQRHDIQRHLTSAHDCDLGDDPLLTSQDSKSSGSVSASTSAESCKCYFCDKTFAFPIMRHVHMREEHGVRRVHLCQFCSEAFRTKDALQKHLMIHTRKLDMTYPGLHRCHYCMRLAKYANPMEYLCHVHVRRTPVSAAGRGQEANDLDADTLHSAAATEYRAASVQQPPPPPPPSRRKGRPVKLASGHRHCYFCENAGCYLDGSRYLCTVHRHLSLISAESGHVCKWCGETFSQEADAHEHQTKAHPEEFQLVAQSRQENTEHATSSDGADNSGNLDLQIASVQSLQKGVSAVFRQSLG